MKVITITTNDGGEVIVNPTGFKGKACEVATKLITDEIGVTKRVTTKPEYYQVTNTVTQKTSIT